VLGRGHDMIIHAVYKDPTGRGKWVVEAELLPKGANATEAVMSGVKPSAEAAARRV